MEDQGKQKVSESEDGGFQVIDKREFVNLDTLELSTVPEEKPRYPSYVEELMTRMAEMERKFEEKKKQIDEEISRTKSRLQADFERRMELDKQEMLLPFLEILDNLQRALAAAAKDEGSKNGAFENFLEGVRITADLFCAKLQSLGVEAIPALGQPFDPNMEQAVGTVVVSEAEKDGIVIEELQTGYIMQGQLLRPAQVRVGRFE